MKDVKRKISVSSDSMRHCATNRKVAGSIPHGVLLEFFIDIIPTGCTMALRRTQPLTEMSITNISWGIKAVGA